MTNTETILLFLETEARKETIQNAINTIENNQKNIIKIDSLLIGIVGLSILSIITLF